jgi:hypothetical protein
MTKTFTSPINADDGEKHYFIGNARSIMNLWLGTAHTGRINWKLEFLDGAYKGKTEELTIDLHFGVGRKVDGMSYREYHRLIGYEGVFELPDEAIALLEEQGYDVSVART